MPPVLRRSTGRGFLAYGIGLTGVGLAGTLPTALTGLAPLVGYRRTLVVAGVASALVAPAVLLLLRR